MNPEQLHDLIAPTLPLEPTLPIELTLINQQFQQADPQATQALFDSHLFPWNGVLFLFIILFTLYGLLKIKRPLKPEEITARIQTQALHVLQSTPSLLSYTSLSQTLRRYIENRLNDNLQGKTTQEILHSLQQTPTFDSETTKQLHAVLEESDQVKFAQHTPTLKEWLHTRKTVEKLLR